MCGPYALHGESQHGRQDGPCLCALKLWAAGIAWLSGRGVLLVLRVMADTALDSAITRLEQALDRAEAAAGRLGRGADETAQELASLKLRHRKLKDTVAQELRQLDLLLAGLPK